MSARFGKVLLLMVSVSLFDCVAGALYDGDVLRFVCPFVRLFVCRLRVLIGHWPDWSSSAIVLAAVSSQSAAGLIRLVARA